MHRVGRKTPTPFCIIRDRDIIFRTTTVLHGHKLESRGTLPSKISYILETLSRVVIPIINQIITRENNAKTCSATSLRTSFRCKITLIEIIVTVPFLHITQKKTKKPQPTNNSAHRNAPFTRRNKAHSCKVIQGVHKETIYSVLLTSIKKMGTARHRKAWFDCHNDIKQQLVDSDHNSHFRRVNHTSFADIRRHTRTCVVRFLTLFNFLGGDKDKNVLYGLNNTTLPHSITSVIISVGTISYQMMLTF